MLCTVSISSFGILFHFQLEFKFKFLVLIIPAKSTHALHFAQTLCSGKSNWEPEYHIWNALRMHIFRSSLNIESVVKCCDCVLHDLCLFSLAALRPLLLLLLLLFLLLSLSLVCIRLSADMLCMMMLMLLLLLMMVAMMLHITFAWIWMCLLCFVLPLTSFSADLFLFVRFAQQSAASLLHECFCRFAFCFLFLFHMFFLLVDRRFCVSWSLFGFQIGSVWFYVLLLVIWYFELRCNHLFRLWIHLTSCFDDLLQLLLFLLLEIAMCKFCQILVITRIITTTFRQV